MVRTKQSAREAAEQKASARTTIASAAPKKAIVKTEKIKPAQVKSKKAKDAPVEEEPAVAEKKAHRWRSGTVALREIRKQQQETNLAIKKAPFRRLVREVVHNLGLKLRIKKAAFEALQHAAEGELVKVMDDSMLNMVHGRRVTLTVSDMRRSLSSNNRFSGDRLQYPIGNSEDPGKASLVAAVERQKAPRKSPPKRNPAAVKPAADAKEPEAVAESQPEPAAEPEKAVDVAVPASEEY